MTPALRGRRAHPQGSARCAYRLLCAAAAVEVAGWLAAGTAPAVEPPATMTAIRCHDYGDAAQLRLERVPRPVPKDGQVLVRVRAASVNPFDWKCREGRLRA